MAIIKKAKNLFGKASAAVRAKLTALYLFAITSKSDCKSGVKAVLADCRGENFVDSGLKILIAVVIGALLLAGLYALFGDTILPTVTNKVKELFGFNG